MGVLQTPKEVAELLELKKRFDDWRANPKYERDLIPPKLRRADLEMNRR